MGSNALQFLSPKSPLPSTTIAIHKNPSTITIPIRVFLPHRGRISLIVVSSTSSDDTPQPAPPPPTVTPPLEVRFKRGSRKRKGGRGEDGISSGEQAMKAAAAEPPKKWEDMNLTEKAIELYVGEKGLLFWLNKFAYASIFIVIGGWLLFRFVGPALNLYQLDTPPLAPDSVFKGS